jgi:hypothetical protein
MDKRKLNGTGNSVGETFSDWDIAKHDWIRQPFNIVPLTNCATKLSQILKTDRTPP